MKQSFLKVVSSVALLGAFLGISQIAFAEEPLTLTENFVDTANAVTDKTAISAKIMRVRGADLWVAVVKNFANLDAQVWAEETFKKSGLQKYDGLVAISTTTREVGFYAGKSTGVTENILDQALNKKVLNLFRAQNWDQGIELLAENVYTLTEGGSLNSHNSFEAAGIIGGAVAFGGIFWLFSRHKKQKTETNKIIELKELSKTATTSLIRVDDLLRSAVAELEFAKAEFGIQATQEFSATLQKAQQAVTNGFAIRRLLEDPEPETPEEQWQMNHEILRLAQQAEKAIATQQDTFTQLRDLATRVDSKISELETRKSEMLSQLPLVAAKIAHLELKFSASMLRSLQLYPAQIENLLKAVDSSIVQAKKQLTAGKRNSAVPYTKMAEETLLQADNLFRRINSAPQELAGAKERFLTNISTLESSIRDADQLAQKDFSLDQLKSVAQALISRAKLAENPDYLAFNEELHEMQIQLDTALAPLREAAEVHKRLIENIEIAKNNATDSIEQAESLIDRYRAGIDANARTLLARAKQLYQQATNSTLETQLSQYQQAAANAHKSIQIIEENISKNLTQSPMSANSTGDFLAGMIVSSVLNGIFSGNGRQSHGFGSGFGSGLGSGFGSGLGSGFGNFNNGFGEQSDNFGGGRKGF